MPEIVPLASIPGGKHNAALVVTVGSVFTLRFSRYEKIEIETERKHQASWWRVTILLRVDTAAVLIWQAEEILDELRRKPHGMMETIRADDSLTITHIRSGLSSLFSSGNLSCYTCTVACAPEYSTRAPLKSRTVFENTMTRR